LSRTALTGLTIIAAHDLFTWSASMSSNYLFYFWA